MKSNLLLFLIGLAFSVSAFSQDINNLPGSIPLEFKRRPAIDLVYQGQPILPDEVTRLVKTKNIDPSFLEPINPTKNIQFDIKSLGEAYDAKLDNLPINDGDIVEYLERIETPLGTYRFQVSKENDSGLREDYVVLFGTTAHKYLLLKNLLRKLGYKVPAMKRLSQLKVEMPGEFSRNELIDDLSIHMDSSTTPSNWIQNFYGTEEHKIFTSDDGEEYPVVSELQNGEMTYYYRANDVLMPISSDEVSVSSKYYFLPEGVNSFSPDAENLKEENAELKTLVFQDVIVLNITNEIINYALGVATKVSVAGRRVFNSLLIPFAMTDINESVNLLPWVCVTQRNKQAFMSYSEINTSDNPFSITHADARWLVRRMAKLSEKDFDEVALNSGYPYEVSLLIAEKLKSCRNQLVDAFKVNEKFYFEGRDYKSKKINKADRVKKSLKVDVNVSRGSSLVDGKITKEVWPGYGSRFAYGDPESPLSGSEMKAFFKSQGISNIISNTVSQFNTSLLSGPDYFERFGMDLEERALQAFIESLQTGEQQKVPFGIFTSPIVSGNVGVSRDVLAGAYLGTDNLNRVQMADRISVSGRAGIFIGLRGLPSDFFGTGEASVSYIRSYDHIRPISSIKLANKEPFKNILIPLTKKKIANILEKSLALSFSESEVFTDEEAAEQYDKNLKSSQELREVMAEFKKNLGVGESIVITNSIASLAALRPVYSIVERLNLQAQLSASKRIVLSRIHILRPSEHSIHVYKDNGDVGSVGMSLGLNYSRVPLISLSFNSASGTAKSEYYNINAKIKKDSEGMIENPKYMQKVVKGLYDIFSNSKVSAFKKIREPYKVVTDFKQKEKAGAILHKNKVKYKTNNLITVTGPGNGVTKEKQFVLTQRGVRKGKNFQKLAVDVANSLISEVTDGSDVNVRSQTNGLPGDTFLGSSILRGSNFSAEVCNKVNKLLCDQYVEVKYRWKGWKASKNKLNEIVKSMEEKFQHQFFDPLALKDIKKVNLYNVELTLSLYERGLMQLAKASEGTIKNLVAKSLTMNEIINADIYCTGKKKFKSPFRVPCTEAEYQEKVISKIKKYQKKYLKAVDQKKSAKDISKNALKLVSLVESLFSAKEFISLISTNKFDGSKNIYIKASIGGFRTGDESAEVRSELVSNTIGRVGSRYIAGPLRRYQSQKLGMAESEFFGYWLRKRY